MRKLVGEVIVALPELRVQVANDPPTIEIEAGVLRMKAPVELEVATTLAVPPTVVATVSVAIGTAAVAVTAWVADESRAVIL